MNLSYPNLLKPSTLRLFNDAYSNSSALKPGSIVMLRDYKIDKDKSNLMAFMSDSVSVLGPELKLKWCKCGYTGSLNCPKCNGSSQKSSALRPVDGNALRGGKKLAPAKNGKYAAFNAPSLRNTVVHMQGGKMLPAPPPRPPPKKAFNNDILGSVLQKHKGVKRPHSSSYSSAPSRRYGPIVRGEDDRYDGSVRVPQSKRPSFTSHKAYEKKRPDARDILEKQRQAQPKKAKL